VIYHIAQRAAWLQAREQGEYRALSLQSEGFIHCSAHEQVLPVANAFYRGETDLLLLVIDETRLGPALKWEPPADPPAQGISKTDLFPHIYGPIPLAAVVRVLALAPDPAGSFSFPIFSINS